MSPETLLAYGVSLSVTEGFTFQKMTVFDKLPEPGSAQTLGWELLSADNASGAVRIQFRGKPEFCNPAGNIQGGFLVAMLDDTPGPTVLVKSAGALYYATIDLGVAM